MNLLSQILLANLASGLISLCATALLPASLLTRAAPRLTGFSVGILLASALTDLLPDAARELDPHHLGLTLLAGLLLFFLLEKASLWRHDHGDLHEGAHTGLHQHAPHPTGMMVVVGDAVHNLTDGVLIAAAFLESPALGISVTLAVMAHEIPHEIGDFMVLLASGYQRKRALLLNALASTTALAGGLLGYFFLPLMHHVTPYVLGLAAASFLYIAAAGLIPAMRGQRGGLDVALQLALLSAGMAVVLAGPEH